MSTCHTITWINFSKTPFNQRHLEGLRRRTDKFCWGKELSDGANMAQRAGSGGYSGGSPGTYTHIRILGAWEKSGEGRPPTERGG